MIDGNGTGFEVHRTPAKTDRFAPAQPIGCGQNKGRFGRRIARFFEKTVELGQIVDFSDEFCPFGQQDIIGWIVGDQLHGDGIFQNLWTIE